MAYTDILLVYLYSARKAHLECVHIVVFAVNDLFGTDYHQTPLCHETRTVPGCFYGIRSPTPMHRFGILFQDGCRTSGWCPTKPLPLYVSHLNQVSEHLSSIHSPGKSLPQRVRSPEPHASAPHDDDDPVVVVVRRGRPP